MAKIFDHDFRTGSLYDKISGAVITLEPGEEFHKGKCGLYIPGKANGAAIEYSVGDAGALIHTTENFSMIIWLYVGQNYNVIFRQNGGYSTGAPGYGLVNAGFQLASTTSVICNGNIAWNLAAHVCQFVHMALTVDRSGYIKGYLNGIYVGQYDISAGAGQSVSGAAGTSWYGASDTSNQNTDAEYYRHQQWDHILTIPEIAKDYMEFLRSGPMTKAVI